MWSYFINNRCIPTLKTIIKLKIKIKKSNKQLLRLLTRRFMPLPIFLLTTLSAIVHTPATATFLRAFRAPTHLTSGEGLWPFPPISCGLCSGCPIPGFPQFLIAEPHFRSEGVHPVVSRLLNIRRWKHRRQCTPRNVRPQFRPLSNLQQIFVYRFAHSARTNGNDATSHVFIVLTVWTVLPIATSLNHSRDRRCPKLSLFRTEGKHHTIHVLDKCPYNRIRFTLHNVHFGNDIVRRRIAK